ncbi:hypothetical protein KXD40_004525 [Peronospora effusa]|uniref:Uncharacterized protein n=1 Tax=Peronospora effusa TaxID=542832 RepID=A0A3R7WUY8_9STRA|nr:hypothetical protein DD237_001523 [Peronospora effusa]UIZ28279.1 hypothetical protein KXD40_004525 [Peronospora effusa]
MPVHAQSLSGAGATRLLLKHMRRSGVLCKMSASTPPRRFGMNTWPVLRVARRPRMFSDQLARQIKSQRMLLLSVLPSQKSARQTASCLRNTVRTLDETQADMKVRASELHAVKDSNKCIPQEGDDAEVNERDEFMNDVYRRRVQL